MPFNGLGSVFPKDQGAPATTGVPEDAHTTAVRLAEQRVLASQEAGGATLNREEDYWRKKVREGNPHVGISATTMPAVTDDSSTAASANQEMLSKALAFAKASGNQKNLLP